jgi:hypothetical protein
MNKTTLSTNFILGGKATFTVQNPKGEHYTFKVRSNEWNGRVYHKVALLTGPDNETSYTYLGRVIPNTGSFILTDKSKLPLDSLPCRVAAFAFRCVWGTQSLPDGYQIRHEGKCGCCGRTLTTPESLDRGIGPECWSRIS